MNPRPLERVGTVENLKMATEVMQKITFALQTQHKPLRLFMFICMFVSHWPLRLLVSCPQENLRIQQERTSTFSLRCSRRIGRHRERHTDTMRVPPRHCSRPPRPTTVSTPTDVPTTAAPASAATVQGHRHPSPHLGWGRGCQEGGRRGKGLAASSSVDGWSGRRNGERAGGSSYLPF